MRIDLGKLLEAVLPLRGELHAGLKVLEGVEKLIGRDTEREAAAPESRPVPQPPVPTQPLRVPTLPRQTIPVPASPAAIPVSTTEWPGPDHPEVRAWIAEQARRVGVEPATLEAVQRWETGHYKSGLFVAAWNVGGIKYRPDLPNLGHRLAPYTASDGIRYARFPGWREGIAAHASFLEQHRYDRVRSTGNALEEVRAIWDAGYSEHIPEWLTGVNKLATAALRRDGAGVSIASHRMLSANFSVDECERTSTGIANPLPDELYDQAARAAACLEAIRKALGRPFTPNSWYRSAAVNRAVGGSSTSDHMTAEAFDLPRTIEFWRAIGRTVFPCAVLLQPEGGGRPDHYHIALSSKFAIRWDLAGGRKEWEI